MNRPLDKAVESKFDISLSPISKESFQHTFLARVNLHSVVHSSFVQRLLVSTGSLKVIGRAKICIHEQRGGREYKTQLKWVKLARARA